MCFICFIDFYYNVFMPLYWYFNHKLIYMICAVCFIFSCILLVYYVYYPKKDSRPVTIFYIKQYKKIK